MARADQAGLQGLDHELLTAGDASLGAAGLDWHAGGDTNLRARDMSVNDVSAHNFSAGGLRASDGQVTLGPTGDARATLAQASVTDATIAGRAEVASGQASGVTASASGGVRRVGLESASVSGVRDRLTGGTLASAEVSGVQTTGDGRTFSTTVDEARLSDGQVSGHRLGGATARGLSVSRDGAGTLHGGFDGLSATGLHGATGGSGIDVATLEARGGRTSLGTDGFGDGSLASLGVTGVRTDAGTAASASLAGISASRDASGVRATGQSGQAADIRLAGGGRIDALSTEGVSAVHGNGRSQLGVRTAEATGVTASGISAERVALQGGSVEHTAGSAGGLAGTFRRGDRGPGVAHLQTLLNGAGFSTGTPDGAFGPATERALIAFQRSAGLSPDGVAGSGTLAALQGGAGPASTRGGFDGLQASTVALDQGGTRASLGSVDATGGRFATGPGGPAASLDRLSVQDARLASAGGGGGSGGGGVDSSALLGSASRLVDDADIRGSVGLNAGEAGPITVRDGTTASGQVRIRDNHIDERNTRVDLSRKLDGPLWTSVSGVRAGRDGQLKADVNGWFDQDVGPMVNESLGLRGDRLHSVGAMGTAASRMEGGGGQSDGPGIVDTESLRLSGDASFNGGTLDAGQAGSLTLADRQHADQNKVTFSADGRGQVVAGVADLLTRGFTTSTDAGTLSGGGARVQDARVQSDASGVRASASSIDARDLQLGRGVPAQ
jgi:peptidoglycan hydrolase-like protein with peptidoglycan-binding domain